MEDSTTFRIVINIREFQKSAIKECIMPWKNRRGQYILQKRPFIKQVLLWIKYYWKWYIVKPLKRKYDI